MSTSLAPNVKAPTGQRKIWIDAVRGFAIALVVIGHVIQSGSHDDFDIFSHPVFSVIYTFHMPLFMLVSGYVAATSFSKHALVPLLTSRIRSLLIPIVAWTAVGSAVAAVLALIFGNAFAFDESAQYIFSGLLNPSSVLWFPWILFVASGMAWVFLWLKPRFGLFPLMISVPIVWVLPITQYFGFFQLKWLYPFFVLGILFSTYKKRLARFERPGVVIALLSFITLLFFWHRDDSVYVSHMQFEAADFFGSLASYAFRYLIALCGVMACIGIIRLISRKRNLKLLAKLGVASMGIYCLQTFLVMILGNAPSPSTNPWVYILLYTPILSAVILGFSYFVTARVFEKQKYLRMFFLGGR